MARAKARGNTQAIIRREARRWQRILSGLKKSELECLGQLYKLQELCDHPDFGCTVSTHKGKDPRTFSRSHGTFTVECKDCGKDMFYDCEKGELHDGK